LLGTLWRGLGGSDSSSGGGSLLGFALGFLLVLGKLLGLAGSQEGSVLAGLLARLLGPSLLESQEVSLVLERAWGDEALDLWCLGAWLLVFGLGWQLTADDVLADIILLAQVEELADVVGTLGTEAAGNNTLKGRERSLTLLDEHQVEGSDIRGNDATTDRSSAASTIAVWSPETGL
jgi:hypothetical protein